MQLSPDTTQATYQIRAYQPGRIQVNATWFEHSIILAAEKLIDNWPPQNLDELQANHFTPIFELNPTIVILGSGDKLRFPPAELLMRFYAKKIGVEVMDTGAACRTYSVLASEGRKVVAALLIR
jgi:uncharacterized protein